MPLSRVARRRPGAAFTLVELLVVVAVIAVLAGLLLPGVLRARANALRTKDLSNLRQVGAALLTYAGDHDGQLPGPMPVGQEAVYTGTMSPPGAYLGYFLAAYLGSPPPVAHDNTYYICPPLVSAALHALRPKDTAYQINFMVNYGSPDLPPDPAGVNGRLSIFGNKGNVGTTATNPGVNPALLATLAAQGTPSKMWMLCDLDQQVSAPSIRASGWFSGLPAKPVHGDARLYLYADGHTAAVSSTIQP